jgi:GGDEF domain-containing protein
MDHIVNNLWLGSQRDADDLIQHNPEGITAILNVRGPDAYQPPGRDQSAEHPGKAYQWIPAPDIGQVSPWHVREAVEWLQEQTLRQERILVHCMFGISRSPAFLAAFMVKSGISASLEEATATIAARRNVRPAIEVGEQSKHVATVSRQTRLPNRKAFDEGAASAFVAVAEVDLMRVFNDAYGEIAGDALLRSLGHIFISVGLDAYHNYGAKFLCKGESAEELLAKLSHAQQVFREPFEIYAEGWIQTIEGTEFSFGIGATINEAQARLHAARKAGARHESPEWLLKIVANTGHGQAW